MSFKKKTKVKYSTPRGAQTGVGVIVDILDSLRGKWYEVRDTASGKTVRLRAANLSLA